MLHMNPKIVWKGDTVRLNRDLHHTVGIFTKGHVFKVKAHGAQGIGYNLMDPKNKNIVLKQVAGMYLEILEKAPY